MGGVQSWVWTVGTELKRRGCLVEEWDRSLPAPSGGFDLGVFANLRHTGEMARKCHRLICVSHGIIPDEEPGQARCRLFVSEGVMAHWGMTGGILRQPIDLGFWKDMCLPREGAIRFSYRKSETLCALAAAGLGMDYRHVFSADPATARRELCRAELVFASGRAALEAMACGAPTVIYDHRSAYQGPLMDTDLYRQMANSYSGRGGICPTINDLIDAASAAKPAREWAQEHHDARRVVDQLLEAV